MARGSRDTPDLANLPYIYDPHSCVYIYVYNDCWIYTASGKSSPHNICQFRSKLVGFTEKYARLILTFFLPMYFNESFYTLRFLRFAVNKPLSVRCDAFFRFQKYRASRKTLWDEELQTIFHWPTRFGDFLNLWYLISITSVRLICHIDLLMRNVTRRLANHRMAKQINCNKLTYLDNSRWQVRLSW